jgi:transketolase C-terminal domain/subunit
MARLNDCTVLSHFSHSGVDEMADNTCHFGRVEKMKRMPLFQNTSLTTAFICSPSAGKYSVVIEGYKFVPGKEEVIRKGSAGYIVSYGDMLYRSLDAVGV